MRILIQRVREASVAIDGVLFSKIGHGIVVLVGVEDADTNEDVQWLVGKMTKLRIFDDQDGVMNLDVTEVAGDVMVVSQFTLHAMTKKGNRPSYIKAARPETAIPLYELFMVETEKLTGRKVAHGVFGAEMQVSLINDGPVTIWIDSKNRE